MVQHSVKNAIASICGSYQRSSQIIAKVSSYSQPREPPKKTSEIFPTHDEYPPSLQLESLLKVTELISEIDATKALIEDGDAVIKSHTNNLKICEEMENLLETYNQNKPTNTDTFRIMKERFKEVLASADGYEKLALVNSKGFLTFDAESSLNVVCERLDEAIDRVSTCIKRLELLEGGITEVMACVETSSVKYDYLNMKALVTFLYDLWESIKMSEHLTEKDELLEAAQLTSRINKSLSSREGRLLNEISKTQKLTIFDELRSKLSSHTISLRRNLIQCLLENIYTDLSDICESATTGGYSVDDILNANTGNSINENFTKSYISSIASALVDLDFSHPSIIENYGKILIESCVSLPQKLYTSALKSIMCNHNEQQQPQDIGHVHQGTCVVSSFRITYASLIALFEKLRYSHSCIVGIAQSAREEISINLEKVLYNLEELIDNESSELLWSALNDCSKNLTIMEKTEIAKFTRMFLAQSTKRSLNFNTETSDVLTTSFYNTISEYHLKVIEALKSLTEQLSQYDNCTSCVSEPYYKVLDPVSFPGMKYIVGTPLSQKFLETISDYIHIARNVGFARVNAINKIKELIRILSNGVFNITKSFNNGIGKNSIIVYPKNLNLMFLHSIADLKRDLSDLVPKNQKFLLSEFDTLEKDMKVRLIRDMLLKTTQEWGRCYNYSETILGAGDDVNSSQCLVGKLRDSIIDAFQSSMYYPSNLKEEIHLSILDAGVEPLFNIISSFVVFSMETKMNIVRDIDSVIDVYNKYEYTTNLAYNLQVYTNDIVIVTGESDYNKRSIMRIPSTEDKIIGRKITSTNEEYSNSGINTPQPSIRKGRKSIVSTITSAFDGILKKD